MIGGGRCTIVGPLLMIVGGNTLPWQEFQSQLVPHDGSQKSPGHHCGPGGSAWASGTPPRPVNPNAAAIAADAIALLANQFMAYAYGTRLCASPADPFDPMRRLRDQVWQVGHQKRLRPSNSAVRIEVPHTRHDSPADLRLPSCGRAVSGVRNLNPHSRIGGP